MLVIGELYDAPQQGKGAKGPHGPARLSGMARCWADDQFTVPLDLTLFDEPPASPTALVAAKVELMVELVRQAYAQYVLFQLVHVGDDIATGRRHWLLICCLYTAHLLARLAAPEHDADS